MREIIAELEREIEAALTYRGGISYGGARNLQSTYAH